MSKQLSDNEYAYFLECAKTVEDLEFLIPDEGDVVAIRRHNPGPDALYGSDCRFNVEVRGNWTGPNPLISCDILWQDGIHHAASHKDKHK